MRFFVASWFFPPSTSSEGIVSYKLFRNSAHTYDVCSSKSTLWSYDQVLEMNASNIEVFAIETNELEEWVDKACALFEERHAKNPYDALMTRSMPPESIEVARRIREKHPDIAWIASLGDPIAKSPYDIKAWVIESSELKEQEKRDFQVALSAGCDAWKDHGLKGIRKMCALKEVEDYAINNATALIFPHDTPKNYVLGVRPRKYAFSVPHTFDKSLYPQSEGTGAAAGAASAGADAAGATAAGAGETVGAGNTSQSPNTKTTFAFLGHSDGVRSLEPVVRANLLTRKMS